MSATHRGSVRAAFDAYETPRWCVRRLFERWRPWVGLGAARWLEPCAANGKIVREIRAASPEAYICAVDIRPDVPGLKDSGAQLSAGGIDSLKEHWGLFDLIVTNPPFRYADEFVTRALESAEHVAMLLPFQRLADGHCGFFEAAGLPYLYVLPDRPSFVATTRCKAKCGWTVHRAPQDPERFPACGACGGATIRGTQDVNCYAWFTWGPKAERAEARGGYEYLAKTSLEERKL